MRNALTIAGKELSSYFVQPVAYVVLTVFVLLAGWFFFALLKQFSEMVQVYSAMSNAQALEHLNLNARVIEPLLHNMSVVMVILVPAITMRAFAEEKRTGTYEFLLTAPIRTGEIVAGKFIAAAVFILIMVALIWIFPIILMVFGDPEVGVMGAGYVALALLGVCFVAIGLFTSSLTQNQIIAAISCLGVLLLLYVISWPLQTGGGILGDLLRYLSLPQHFGQMVGGVIDTSDIVYFCTMIFVALFLTQRSVESARWRQGRAEHGMQRSMASAGLIGLVFLFFALVAYLTGARLYFLFNLVLGVLAVVLWATSSRDTLGTMMGHRAARYGANAVVYSLGFVGVLIAINYILALHHRRFDLTSENLFSL